MPRTRTVTEWIAIAESLVAEHGRIPDKKWLRTHGHGGLTNVMLRHPDGFANFPRNRKPGHPGRTIEELVAIAEKLAKEHDGTLPSSKWQQTNGFSMLCRKIREFPDSFSHIPRKPKRRTVDRWVKVAEEIARVEGALPQAQWLLDNKYGALYVATRSYPDHFSHIPRKAMRWEGKSPQEWVVIAENVASEHGGRLPRYAWLRRNGYGGLKYHKKRHPELFAHIPQGYLTVEEWVTVAEKLAAEHKSLPPSTWLKAKGYKSLAGVMRRVPEKFAHVPKRRLKLSVEEWVQTAKELEAEHKGLPRPQWLCANGYWNLYVAMRRHPEAFVDIRQQSSKASVKRTLEEWVVVANELAAAYEGLPRTNWLCANGFHSLYGMMREYPELFAEIPRRPRSSLASRKQMSSLKKREVKPRAADPKKRRPKQLTGKFTSRPSFWVKVAEELVNLHNGKLPADEQLINYGYKKLIVMRQQHPKLFSKFR